LAVLLAAMGGGLASPSPAQETTPGVPPPAPAAVARAVVELPSPAVEHPPAVRTASRTDTEITLDKQSRLTAGIGFGGPLGAMGSVRLLHGLGADVRDGEGRVRAVCAVPIPHCAQGFTLQADAGSGGGKVSLGVGARARVEELDFRGTVGAGLRLSLARTWGSPIGTDPGLTYLGPELDLSVVRVNLTLGVLWRVSGQGGASALFSWGVGFGL
jgi:hypothetical protein